MGGAGAGRGRLAVSPTRGQSAPENGARRHLWHDTQVVWVMVLGRCPHTSTSTAQGSRRLYSTNRLHLRTLSQVRHTYWYLRMILHYRMDFLWIQPKINGKQSNNRKNIVDKRDEYNYMYYCVNCSKRQILLGNRQHPRIQKENWYIWISWKQWLPKMFYFTITYLAISHILKKYTELDILKLWPPILRTVLLHPRQPNEITVSVL